MFVRPSESTQSYQDTGGVHGTYIAAKPYAHVHGTAIVAGPVWATTPRNYGSQFFPSYIAYIWVHGKSFAATRW